MSQATVTDIHLVPFRHVVGPGHSQGMNLWLMTSPKMSYETPVVGCRAGLPAVPQLP